MQLTADQLQSLVNGVPIRVTEAGIDCVVVRADVFDQIGHVVSYDEWTPAEMRALAERTFDDADTAGTIS